MSKWLGKVFGTVLGLVFSQGAWEGAFVGFLIGMIFDYVRNVGAKVADQAGWGPYAESAPTDTNLYDHEHLDGYIQAAFFRAIFTALGRMAKLDGPVTQSDIQFAESLMKRMGAADDQRQQGIDYFKQGKQPQTQLHRVIASFVEIAGKQHTIYYLYMEIIVEAACANGPLAESKWRLIQQLAQWLGVSEQRLDALVQRFNVHEEVLGHEINDPGGLAGAYQVLGVSASVSQLELKKAYRRLMSQHHPDKLIAQGASADVVELAKDRTQSISAAYERICQARRR